MRHVRTVLWLAALTVGLLGGIGRAAPGYAADDDDDDGKVIVVSATKMETEGEKVASSYTVIDRAAIERTQSIFVLDLLRSVPGIDISPNGGTGQQTAIQIRGAKSEHTLVLIDGIEVNDPISPGRTFNIGSLTTENIERIEIIRGPQSTLYGSDAIGGVINIITRRGRGRPTAFLSAEAGSFGTFRQQVGVSGGGRVFNYSVSAQNFETEGISAAHKDYGNTERDGFRGRSFSARFGLSPSDSMEVDLFLRHGSSEGDMDDAGGFGGDDVNRVFDSTWNYARLQASFTAIDDVWDQIVGVSVTDLVRHDHDDQDVAHPGERQRSEYSSRLVKFDWQHNVYLSKTNTLTVGLETEEEQGKSELYGVSAFGPFTSAFPRESARTNGFYIQDQLSIGDSFFATLGARVDDHSDFGSKTTWRVAPAYLIHETGTKLKATYGTGFKAPTLYQLFSPYGDPTLKPEESKGWDAGFEQEFFDGRATFGATYFSNRFDNMIDFDSATFTYKNIAKARTRGVELTASAQPCRTVSLRATYTRTDTEDGTTGHQLIRRPNNKASLDVVHSCLDGRGKVGLGVVYVGRRKDTNFGTFPASPVTLGSYTLLNLTASYDVTKNLQVFARVENLLDRNHEPIYGFGGAGRGLYVGMKLGIGGPHRMEPAP